MNDGLPPLDRRSPGAAVPVDSLPDRAKGAIDGGGIDGAGIEGV